MDNLTETKTTHPADGSPRWIVAGSAGKVIYDILGNHLALIYADGEIDAMGKEYADEARSVSEYYDDSTVFRLLGDHYYKHLAGRAA
jgi:hypothetical protein